MKHKCLVYGNCQAMAINNLLSAHPEFNKRYDLIPIKGVHLLSVSDVRALEEIAPTLSLFVYQSVSEGYRGIKGISTESLISKLDANCQKISFPSAYFTGYHPEITVLKSKEGTVKGSPFPHHDINILRLFSEGKTVNEVLSALSSQDYYSCPQVTHNLELTLSNLKKREQHLNIHLSDFIKENFRGEKLFHVFNHPSNRVIEFLIQSVLLQVSIHPEDSIVQMPHDRQILALSSYPIYHSLASCLDLQFSDRRDYKIQRKIYSMKEVVETYFRFYEQHSAEIPLFLEYTVSRT